MNGNDLKQLLKIPLGEPGDKKRPPKLLVWSIIGAIVFLALGGFSGGDQGKKTAKEDSQEKSFVFSEYVAELEERLVSVLENIEGAGRVTVFLSMESSGERILAADIKTVTSENEEDKRTENHYEREEEIVLSEMNSGQSPYVIAEKLPQPAGVLVIAEGARSERIRLEIYEAVKAVFGLAAHRIKVSY